MLRSDGARIAGTDDLRELLDTLAALVGRLERLAPEDRAYSAAAAGALLGGLSERSVRRLMADGALPYITVGRTRLVTSDGLRTFLAARARTPRPRRLRSV